jgi:precorrin-2 methylase
VQEVPTNTNTGVQVSGSTTPTKGSSACVTGCVPGITSINVLSARATATVVITGLSLSAVTKVYFRLDTTTATSDVEAATVTVNSDTQLSVVVPAGLVTGEFYTIRVATPDKTSARFYDIEILP